MGANEMEHSQTLALRRHETWTATEIKFYLAREKENSLRNN